jgi:hypothetical protein
MGLRGSGHEQRDIVYIVVIRLVKLNIGSWWCS